MSWFVGFDSYVRKDGVNRPIYGEVYTKESQTIPNDDINVAEAVRRITRGELLPLRDLSYGVDHGDLDEVDAQSMAIAVRDLEGSESSPSSTGAKPVSSTGAKPVSSTGAKPGSSASAGSEVPVTPSK